MSIDAVLKRKMLRNAFSLLICIWSCRCTHANLLASSLDSNRRFCQEQEVSFLKSCNVNARLIFDNLKIFKKIHANSLRYKVNWLAYLRPTHDRSFGWREVGWRLGGRGDHPSEPQSRIIKNLTQFKRTVSRDISARSKIPPTSVDKIVLETFWLRHRERQPDLPQWGNCSAKEPYRDWSAQPNTQLHLHFSLRGTCAHELENTLLHLLPSGKHFPETLCLFLSSVTPKMPCCTTNPAWQPLIFLLYSLKHLASVHYRLVCIKFTYMQITKYTTNLPWWPFLCCSGRAMQGWVAAKLISMDATVTAGSWPWWYLYI